MRRRYLRFVVEGKRVVYLRSGRCRFPISRGWEWCAIRRCKTLLIARRHIGPYRTLLNLLLDADHLRRTHVHGPITACDVSRGGCRCLYPLVVHTLRCLRLRKPLIWGPRHAVSTLGRLMPLAAVLPFRPSVCFLLLLQCQPKIQLGRSQGYLCVFSLFPSPTIIRRTLHSPKFLQDVGSGTADLASTRMRKRWDSDRSKRCTRSRPRSTARCNGGM